VEPLDPETLLSFLRDVGNATRDLMTLYIGGSSALILAGYLRRNTNDVVPVDELPPAIRNNHELLALLVERYDLRLAPFQSHNLPGGWRDRVHSLGHFGAAQVYLVDLHDIFLGKIFSKRTKDFVDLRGLMPAIDRKVLGERVRNHAAPLADDPRLREAAAHNWAEHNW
jgi:hypothetical protein